MSTSRLVRVSPLQAAKVFGVLYGIFGLLAVPFLLIGAASSEGRIGYGIALFLPVFYAVGGFLGMALFTWLFNVVCGWLGGIEITLETQSG